MRLLLDEMFPPAVARALRERGHDVVAVKERPELTALSDPELFEIAQREERVIVTENVVDFMPLDGRCRVAGRDHHGLVFILKESLPRKRSQFIGTMVRKLEAWLHTQPRKLDQRSVIAWP